jgi:hypothetical protein
LVLFTNPSRQHSDHPELVRELEKYFSLVVTL